MRISCSFRCSNTFSSAIGMAFRSLELGLSEKTGAVEYGADGSVLVAEFKREESTSKKRGDRRRPSGRCDQDGLLRAAFMLERMDQYSEGLQEFVDRQIAEGLESLLVMSDY